MYVDVLRGLLVVFAAFGVVTPLLWWLSRENDREMDAEMVLQPSDVLDAEETQIIRFPTTAEALIVDMRAVPDEPAPVVDELGAWMPWEHQIEQPVLMGHVLVARPWATLNPAELGLVAA